MTDPSSAIPEGKAFLAALNASLNGASAILLLAGYALIKSRRVRAHLGLMLSALVTSGTFLYFYLYSYFKYGDVSSKHMLVSDGLRLFYLILLASHVLLAVAMLPMIATTIWRASRRQWPEHRKIATPTFWIWLYVSVTGVVIYWMLYHLFPTMGRPS
ncbi:MAG: DUF420 domain-containing protein [Tepidisphaeraceae bacterium]